MKKKIAVILGSALCFAAVSANGMEIFEGTCSNGRLNRF